MSFRPDNVADILGVILGLILLVMAYIFERRMRKSGAEVWVKVGGNVSLAAIFFTVGMLFTFSTVLFDDDISREILNLVGNIFWLPAAYFSYRMLSELASVMGVIFGE